MFGRGATGTCFLPGIMTVPGNLGSLRRYGKASEMLHKLKDRRAYRTQSLAVGGQEGVDIVDWRHEAGCREVDPELFFPIGNSGPALLQIEEAKQVCRRCSVMQECLRWAIDSGQDAGVWGGLSEEERRALKRRTIRLRARAHA
jgi:WhiB family transcriptional regulator, redox-sensing transcriptional regulator